MINLISDMIEVVMITFIAYIPHIEDEQHNKCMVLYSPKCLQVKVSHFLNIQLFRDKMFAFTKCIVVTRGRHDH